MVLKKHLELEIILFLFLGAAVGFFFVRLQGAPDQFANSTDFSSKAAVSEVQPTSAPEITTPPALVSQISSDGMKTVTVEAKKNKDATTTFTVSTNDKKELFSETLNIGERISLPFNTWSADNRYFFIKETIRDGVHILIFRANGEPFADGSAYIDMSNIFKERVGDIANEATGWAEDNLIIINTTMDDGSQGRSYWFAVPSKALIPLSTKF